MKLPLSFLSQYIDLKEYSLSDLSEILTLSGMEVEKIENEFPSFTNVVVAKVEEATPHPNADKLQIATVFDGENRYQVVCGATNCKKGLITAFAKEGAVLTTSDGETFKIKSTEK